MNRFVDGFRVALGALRSNPLRATLTTGGIVVGIFFVLVMGWVLDGLDRAFTDSFAFFGDDIIFVDRFDWSGSIPWARQMSRPPITMQDYRALRERTTVPRWVVPTVSRDARRIEANDFLTDGTIFGTTSAYIEMYAGNLKEGRFFAAVEDQSASPVAVLGFNIAERLFPHGSSVGQFVSIDRTKYRVIGVMPKRGTVLVDFVDNIILIPISRYTARYGSSSITINLRPDSPEEVEEMKDEAIGAMRSIRSLRPADDLDFGVNTQEMFTELIDTTRLVVWGIGLFLTGLAFLVGSIGIMNIMFVSVTERRREIGIRKSVGATRSAILLQFLIEAVVLCLLGAVVGIFLAGLVVGFKEQVVLGVLELLEVLELSEGETEVDLSFLGGLIPITQIIVAVFVASMVGLAAGIIPAYRASRLSPVEALDAN